MYKRILSFFLVSACVLVLCACTSPNKYGLSLAADGSNTIDYIYYEDEFAVYVVGGIMTVEINGESKLLELAITDGNITVSDILASAEEDHENEDITKNAYPDGSVEYSYENFKLVRLNTYDGRRDIYFLPTTMSYYDIAN